MKVAMLTTVGEHCGIAPYTRELVGPLSRYADVTAETIREGKQSADYYREQAARLNAADVIHIQHEYGFWGGILPGKSAYLSFRRMLTKPVTVTAHTTSSLGEMLRVNEERRLPQRAVKQALLAWRSYRDSVEKLPFERAAACIVHTLEGRRALIGRGLRPDHVHHIPAGFPQAVPGPSHGEAVRRRYGLGGKRIVALFGYITATKGYELMLAALPELPPEVSFLIAGGTRIEGEAPYLEQLQRDIAGAGLEDRVAITGHLSEPDIADVMEASEVVITPHTRATGSYTVRIALAYGKPVVSSDRPCFKEIQDDASCMRLFRTGDAAHFTACLKGVLANEQGRAEMAQRARAYAAKYSWDEVARRTFELYKAAGGG